MFSNGFFQFSLAVVNWKRTLIHVLHGKRTANFVRCPGKHNDETVTVDDIGDKQSAIKVTPDMKHYCLPLPHSKETWVFFEQWRIL